MPETVTAKTVMPRTVMIVTGESSGELYGSLLARELKVKWPGIRVLGVGGQRMRSAGVEVFAGIAGAFGLIEALSALRDLRETFRRTVAMLKEASPDVVVLIDYPDFNFKVAKEAGKLGIKVLYYVSPQVWAWRKGRVKTMARIAQRIAVVLPFEVDIFRAAGMPCEFVGHPILDEMGESLPDKTAARNALGLEDRPHVALLPGSRHVELSRLLPIMLEVARRLKAEHPSYGLLMALAPNIKAERYEAELKSLREEGVTMISGNAVLALSAADAAVIASGTATLQATFLQVPMVAIYKVSALTYMIGRIVVDVDFITITNLVLKKAALPELMQGRANTQEIMRELAPLLTDAGRREGMLRDLREARGMFDGRRPSHRVAEIVGEMAGWAA